MRARFSCPCSRLQAQSSSSAAAHGEILSRHVRPLLAYPRLVTSPAFDSRLPSPPPPSPLASSPSLPLPLRRCRFAAAAIAAAIALPAALAATLAVTAFASAVAVRCTDYCTVCMRTVSESYSSLVEKCKWTLPMVPKTY